MMFSTLFSTMFSTGESDVFEFRKRFWFDRTCVNQDPTRELKIMPSLNIGYLLRIYHKYIFICTDIVSTHDYRKHTIRILCMNMYIYIYIETYIHLYIYIYIYIYRYFYLTSKSYWENSLWFTINPPMIDRFTLSFDFPLIVPASPPKSPTLFV